ncbi:MAG: ACT domain-containing protein [Bdellovibrionota bacterium]
MGLEAAQIDTSLSKVSLVGSGMRSHSGVAARVFKTLARGQIPIVCTTTSEIKISCVVPKAHSEKALQSLHDEFCLVRS